ncbi:MAG: hypothetical protein JWO74_1050, partial [Solirubrobacterales bacterium]|nr:hypothetical protein [Solirubrobacterales bacterium]
MPPALAFGAFRVGGGDVAGAPVAVVSAMNSVCARAARAGVGTCCAGAVRRERAGAVVRT